MRVGMSQPIAPRTYLRTFLARALTGVLPMLTLASGGCLDRPVTPARPTTTNVYVGTVANHSVDKVDMLFMIDNSL